MPVALIHHRPQTGLEAKFSMEYCLAILLLDRKAGLVEFTDERVRRADVQEMLGKINLYVDAGAENAGYDKMTSILKIHLKSGQTISGSAGFAKGSPSDLMTFEETVDKFKGCAEYARWEKTKTSRIINLIANLEKIPDVRVLGPLLARDQTDTSSL
jgi:2-methylcitrate dehydratase PrpD